MEHNLENILSKQRLALSTEGFPSIEARVERLDRAIRMLLDYEQRFVDALYDDFGGRARFTSKAGDILGSIRILEYTKQHLAEWMQPEPVKLPDEVTGHGLRAEVVPAPLGVIGVIIPWNGPVLLTCSAVACALGAGNRVMVKVPENTPRTSRLLAEAFGKYFSEDEIAIIQGDAEVANAFSRQKFDHILFTGSEVVGRKVMRAAAENLVPVTLELGGKCPVIVGRSADLQQAVRRIITGKMAGSGQVCVASDYVFVPKGKTEEFISEAFQTAQTLYPDILNNEDFTAVINQTSRARIRGLIADAAEKGATLRQYPENTNEQAAMTRMPFTIACDVSPDMRIMQEEIFGPILAVMEYEDFDEALDYIAQRPHPLSASYFGTDENEQNRFLKGVQTGGIVFNDVRIQLYYEALPFGGVGSSGMGRYRGHAGFKAFSNFKTVLYQHDNDELLSLQRPPFGDNAFAMVDSALAALRQIYSEK